MGSSCRTTTYGIQDPREIQRDGCGVGFVTRLNGTPQKEIVDDGLTILKNLTHRGATGCDPETGDGAGIMLAIDDCFFRKRCRELGIRLPRVSAYGVGMLFLPSDEEPRRVCKERLQAFAEEEGAKCLGYREVPADDSVLGWIAADARPQIEQVFISKPDGISDEVFEWKLYVIRKRLENEMQRLYGEDRAGFHAASLSSNTITYKGLLLSDRIGSFYEDLVSGYRSPFALVHQRFSTNTFPTWDLAQPLRFLGHNGEINTLRGNVNWMYARAELLLAAAQKGELPDPLNEDLIKLGDICTTGASDSAILDNVVEFLHMTGRSLPKALTTMIPEPWRGREDLPEAVRDYYEYQSCIMEPWDGPAFVCFTDGRYIGAMGDRNGLRPGRYLVTTDGRVVMASETGVLDIEDHRVVEKGRLSPGRLFLVDLAERRIIPNREIKGELASEHPYGSWLAEGRIPFSDLPIPTGAAQPRTEPRDHTEALTLQKAFGYTLEEKRMLLAPMAEEGKEPVGSMGTDTPLAVLSGRSRLLYDYFMQLFAQVTNPPIDAIREELVTSLDTLIGPEGNLLQESPDQCRKIRLDGPILTDAELETLRHVEGDGFRAATLETVFPREAGASGLRERLDALREEAEEAVHAGNTILVLCDRAVDEDHAPIPALLAVAACHHHLIRKGLRTRTSLVVASGEPREVHHMALLIGYGATAINPWLALEAVRHPSRGEGFEARLSANTRQSRYVKAVNSGLLKIMSKMGISTLQSYRGAQIFESVGLSQDVIDEFFTRTTSRIEGIGLDEIAREVFERHGKGFTDAGERPNRLDVGGEYHWRRDGEAHLHDPQMITGMQKSARLNSREEFKEFCRNTDERSRKQFSLRGSLEWTRGHSPVPVEEVEPASEIVKRFSTGAMSYGSISKEAHETLAVAMNRMGGKSNSGEGGEDPARFTPDPDGSWRRSSVKQIASGRFGVTGEYLANADELQIKIAQGAKPGEGGQLPGHKVNVEIARVRHSTAGVPLISPPPHHDIYSIEDLAQLIHDLKCANPEARISVKLVSAAGVGTIAAGVAKAKSDVIMISGYDGGTGASPLTSIKHAGLPWELGLAETQRVLVENDLRGRVRLQTDGGLRTARDIAMATMLGAEEWSMGSGALVLVGCIMMRKCHLNTCPVGIATQDPELRAKFAGTSEHVINYFFLLAEELREIMADLGFRKVDDMVGRMDLLHPVSREDHWKARNIKLDSVVEPPKPKGDFARYQTITQDHGIEKSFDAVELIPRVEKALENQKPVRVDLAVRNIHRTVGTVLSGMISKRYGKEGLPEGTINLRLTGSAGQSFMAFGAPGITAQLVGDVNDYCGKGLCGAHVVVAPSPDSRFAAEESIVCGNVALYGATGGELFVRGRAGERFGVRNSGATAVVEGTGDHGCEYMTGGRILILGETGRNFAAGMSGGIAYVFDDKGRFPQKVNSELVDLEALVDSGDEEFVLGLLERHLKWTGSSRAAWILEDWNHLRERFVRVIPRAYKEAMAEGQGSTKAKKKQMNRSGSSTRQAEPSREERHA